MLGKWTLVGTLLLSSLFASRPREVAQAMVGIGWFDVDRSKRQAQFQFEYRPHYCFQYLRPLVGAFVTQKGSTFGYGGIAYDIFLGNHVVLTPSFAPGVYFHAGGKNLGHFVEFRSSIELAWIRKDQSRLGMQFYHLSNAGLSHPNPGEQSLIVFYSIPLGL